MGKRKKSVVGIVAGGVVMLLSQIVGFCGYRIGMNRAQTTLAATGITNPGALSGNIDTVLYSLIAACAGFLIGLVILICALVRFRRTQRDAV